MYYKYFKPAFESPVKQYLLSAIRALFCIMITAIVVSAQEPEEENADQPPAADIRSEFSVEQPGSITFKTGVTIIGNVEKPQVLIFLPKEKSFYREIAFTRSFGKEAAEPMPFEPLSE
jgi:hypothetical protein